MAEKRADYRKSQQHKKLSQLWSRHQVKEKDKNARINTVEVNPKFKRNDGEVDVDSKNTSEEKVLHLKRKLNWAILIVIILIIIVLLALFKL